MATPILSQLHISNTSARLWGHPLTYILTVHLALGLAFGAVTPIFEAPDEANHFLFIRYLQLHRALPVQGLDQDGPRAHHPPLYFALGALASAWVPGAGGAERIELAENGSLWFRYGDAAVDHKVKFVHAPAEGWPGRGQALAVHVLRPLSALLSAAAVLFTYLAARQVAPGWRPMAVLAAGLLAFNPMVLFMSGVVQNSTAALAAAAALLYALSRWLRQGFTLARWAWLGTLFSAGVLVQTSSLALAAPVALALAYDAWCQRRLRRLLAAGLAFGLPVLALTGWWFARNFALYGDWTANTIVAALWSDQPVMPFEQVVYLLLTGMVGRFGFGLIIEYPGLVYRAAWWLAAASLAGLAPLAVAGLRRGRRAWLSPDAAQWALVAVTVAAVSAALAAYIIWFIRGGHGRYMFTAYPALALLLAAGALGWLRLRGARLAQWQPVLVGALLAFWLGLSLYGLLGLVRPAFALPRTPNRAELAAAEPLDATIDEAARLLGYRLSASRVQPGQVLEVTVYWQPLAPTATPQTVFVHLYHPAVGVIAQQDTWPGAGTYATSVWDAGRVFADTYRLRVPPEAPAIEAAEILIGLYDSQSMQRLPVTGASAGSPNERWAHFGAVTVGP